MKTYKRSDMFSSLLAINTLYWICAGTFSPFMSGYFTRLGFSGTQTGILLAVLPVCSIFVQPVWSRVADRLGQRKRFLILLSIAASGCALLFYAVDTFIFVLGAMVLFSAFFQALLPLCDSLVIGAADRLGLDFSRIRIGGTVGYAVVVALAGRVIEVAPALQFVFVSVSLFLFAFACRKLPDRDADEHVFQSAAPGGRKGLSTIFTTDRIVIVLLLAFISYVGLGFHGTFLGRYCVELGYGQDFVGILSAVSALSEVPILLVADRLIAFFGEIKLLLFACFAMALRLVLTGTGSYPLMLAAQLLQSVSYMTVYYACVTFIEAHTRPDTKAQGQSVLVMVQAGFATVIANLLGGAMGDALGFRVSFFIVALAISVAALATGLYARKRGAFETA